MAGAGSPGPGVDRDIGQPASANGLREGRLAAIVFENAERLFAGLRALA